MFCDVVLELFCSLNCVDTITPTHVVETSAILENVVRGFARECLEIIMSISRHRVLPHDIHPMDGSSTAASGKTQLVDPFARVPRQQMQQLAPAFTHLLPWSCCPKTRVTLSSHTQLSTQLRHSAKSLVNCAVALFFGVLRT